MKGEEVMGRNSGRGNKTSKRVRALIADGATSLTELTDKLGRVEKARISSALQNLVNQGKLVRTGRGTFMTTDKLAAPEGVPAKSQSGLSVRKRGRPRANGAAETHDDRRMRKRPDGSFVGAASAAEDEQRLQAIRALEHQVELLGAKVSAYEEALRFLRAEADEER